MLMYASLILFQRASPQQKVGVLWIFLKSSLCTICHYILAVVGNRGYRGSYFLVES